MSKIYVLNKCHILNCINILNCVQINLVEVAKQGLGNACCSHPVFWDVTLPEIIFRPGDAQLLYNGSGWTRFRKWRVGVTEATQILDILPISDFFFSNWPLTCFILFQTPVFAYDWHFNKKQSHCAANNIVALDKRVNQLNQH